MSYIAFPPLDFSFLDLSESLQLLDVGIEPALEFFNAHLLIGLGLVEGARRLWGDENGAQDVDDTVLGNSILDGNTIEAVDLDGNESAPSRNINAQALLV